MIQRIEYRIQSILKSQNLSWLANCLAFMGALLFGMRLWYFAHLQASDLDEGFYAYEGLLYALGKYQPFQDYGFPFNQMPFAYLIPGYIQRWFGPSFLVGRYAAILVAMLFLTGLWILSKRMGGKWIAAGIVWAVALNPFMQRTYSLMATQVIGICLLIWVLVLLVGVQRRFWKIIIGSVLAAVLVLTRINLIPFIPLLIFYIFWQHGKRAGIYSTIVIFAVLVAVHIIYWPNIMRLWAFWLPRSLTPFLDAFRLPDGIASLKNPTVSSGSSMESIIFTLRSHLLSILGFLTVCVLWPIKKDWKSPMHFKASVFLIILFTALAVLHIWAALGMNYCIYCLESYFAFFSPLSFLLVASTCASWRPRLSKTRTVVAILVVVLPVAVIIFDHSRKEILTDQEGRWLPAWNFISQRISGPILDIEVPRIGNDGLQEGKVPLWSIVENKLGWSWNEQQEIIFRSFLISGILALSTSAAWLVSSRMKRKGSKQNLVGVTIFMGAVGMSLFLYVLTTVGDQYGAYDCELGVDSSYKAVGDFLSQAIPPDVNVYWESYTPMILLYAQDIQIYPPQIYLSYYKASGGDPDVVYRYGWWNDELAKQWMSEAEIALVEEWHLELSPDLVEQLNLAGFAYVNQTPLSNPCRQNSYIHVFQKNP